MLGVNKAILVGNLGADPEVRYSSTGTAVTSFRMATSENWTTKEGERETRTEWHRVVAFGKLGEICAEYLTKGRQVYVEGRLRSRSWEDKEGNKRWVTEVVATNIVMLGAAGEQLKAAEGESLEEPPETVAQEDDIPF
ncbi:MAG: single-stranded DNA-binding protein [Deltaproteobacteria bacterium]|nr:MAG: single-stranded DNA-binding protein [Deltaproteobacteria bacterium]